MEPKGRPRSTEPDPRDTTLLSASAIGSPLTFSTAIKPPLIEGSHPSGSADTSLLGQDLNMDQQQLYSADVTGRLSLNSTGSQPEHHYPLSAGVATDGTVSLDDTSVGILDLEAMQDSSMTQFLTSPRSSQPQFHLQSGTSTDLSTASTVQPSLQGSTTGRESATRASPSDASQVEGQRAQVIPQEFLERASSASTGGYSSQSSYEEPLGERPPPQDGGLIGNEQLESDHPATSLPLTRPSGDGHENEPMRWPPQSSSDAPTPYSTVVPVNLSVASIGAEVVIPSAASRIQLRQQHPADVMTNGLFHDVEDILQLMEGEVGPLSDHEEDMANATLLADEVEPTVMRDADEFSQYEPTHLTSLLNRDSFLRSIRPPVTTGQELTSQPCSTTAAHVHVPTPHQVSGEQNGSFPAIVDRYNVLHGDLKVSEQIRPVAEGFTERDLGLKVDPHKATKKVGPRTVERCVSEGYFSSGQPSETSINDAQMSRQTTGASLPSGGSVRLQLVEEGSDSGSEDYASARSESPLPDVTIGEGLPSAYLLPTSPPTFSMDPSLTADGTGLGQLVFRSRSASPSNGSQSSLASSLSELAKGLGDTAEKQLPAESSLGRRDTGEPSARHSQSGVYNPFDSDDNASVESFGQLEFHEQSSDSFLAQLAQDEKEVQNANLFTNDSTSHYAFSFEQDVTEGSSRILFNDSSGDVSIGSYFRRKSHTLGVLPEETTPKLSPSERPNFSDSHSHIIQSPEDETTPTIQQSTNQKSVVIEDDCDTTLIEDSGTKVKTSLKKTPGNQPDSLTPIVSVHTPFPNQFQIPKLDLDNVSTLSARGSYPGPRTSTTVKHSRVASSLPPRLSTPLGSKEQPPTTGSVHTSELKKSPRMESGPSAGMESRPSTGMVSGLPSHYLKPHDLTTACDGSTLMFPEVSALTYSPPGDLGSLSSFPTPSIARLSAGFDVTNATYSGSFLRENPIKVETKLDLDGTVEKTVSELPHGPLKAEGPSLQHLGKTRPKPARMLHKVNAVHSMKQPSPPQKVVDSMKQPSPPQKVVDSLKQPSPPQKVVDSLKQPLPPQKVVDSMKQPSPPQKVVDSLKQPSPPQKTVPGVSHHRKRDSQSRTPKSDLSYESLPPPATTVSSEQETCQVFSPKTKEARKKMANLQATLDSARFDADAFLANLKSSPLSSPLHKGREADLVGHSRSSPVVSSATLHDTGPPPRTAAASIDTPTVVDTPRASTSLPSVLYSTEKLQTSITKSPFSNFEHSDAARLKKYHSIGVTPTESPIKGQDLSERLSGSFKPSLSPPQDSPYTQLTETKPITQDTPRHPTSSLPEFSVLPSSITSTLEAVKLERQTSTPEEGKKPPSPAREKQTRLSKSPTKMPPKAKKDFETSPKRQSLKRKSHSPATGRETTSSGLPTSDSSKARRPGLTKTGPPDRKTASTPQAQRSPKTQANTTATFSPGKLSSLLSPKARERDATTAGAGSPVMETTGGASGPPRSYSSPQKPGVNEPIYTSPHVHTHTTYSPSKGKRRGMGVSTAVPDPSSLSVPDSLCFTAVGCVGATLFDHFSVSNSGERWLQLHFTIAQLYRDGSECSADELRVFTFPQRCFVGPHKSESVKVTFAPLAPGNYEGILSVQAMPVVGGEQALLTSTVILKALAEKPKLEVLSGHQGPPVLDYGVLVGGTSVSLPLRLANHGSSELPLRITIASSTLSQLYFSFEKVPPSLLPSSPHLHHQQPYSARLTLPAKPPSQVQPTAHTLQLHFKAPKKYTYADDSSDPGPPEEISTHIDITVDGTSAVGTICSVPVRAIVGVARLHVPRSLQALSLSCTTGQAVTRDVPFKNAGNIPVRVRLKTSSDTDHFTVAPDFLLMEPREEVQVSVCFSPLTAPLTSEASLIIHVEPSGPNYEMRLRGTATKPEIHKEGLLSCSRRSLYWGGVRPGHSVQQKVVLHNSFQNKVPLKLSIRHPDSAFQLPCVSGVNQSVYSQEITILPQEQLPVNVVFTPSDETVYSSALDIHDTMHSKKYRIVLCGYGGTGHVEVVNARRSPQGSWIDIGEVVADQRNVVKVSLYNSGERATFVKALCYSAEDSSVLLPVDQASVSPTEMIIQPQHMKELLLIYHASERDEHKCMAFPTPLAQLVLLTGDEIVRQRFLRSQSGEKAVQLVNPLNQTFLKQIPDQEIVPTELELRTFEVEDEEKFFEHQLTNTSISLSGSPPTESPIPRQHHVQPKSTSSHLDHVQPRSTSSHLDHVQPRSTSSHLDHVQLRATHLDHVQPQSTHLDHVQPRSTSSHLDHVPSLGTSSPPPKTVHQLSPSHTPHAEDHTPSGHTPSLLIVSSHTLIFPDTPTSHYSEKFLEVHNPYSHPLKWSLSSAASPYVRDTVEGSDDIYKATYSSFWVQERRGTILPHVTAKVLVTFQPHDKGSFSQIWDLQVTVGEIGTKKLRLSFGGKAVATPIHRKTEQQAHLTIQDMASKSHPVSEDMGTSSAMTYTTPTVSSPSKVTPPKRSVYLKDERVEFPATKVGMKSLMKVRVCNRDPRRYQFEVIKPNPPFSISHHNFELGTRQCARLPVHFSPIEEGEYESVLAIRTDVGHQTFAVLRGKSFM